MRAIILAGGQGVRLKPFTTVLPKPLVPIGGEKTILEIIIHQLCRCGFTHITLAVNYLAQLIMAFFGDGSKWGIQIDYSLENQPLSTIGPLALIRDLPENFLVLNGDILCDLDFRDFFEYHLNRKNDLTVSSFQRKARIDFGVLKYDENHQLVDFLEKPTYQFDVTMGINCLNRSLISHIPHNIPYGFDHLMVDAIKKKYKIEIKNFGGFWLDIGRPEDYDYANENYKDIKEKIGLKE
jgi:NDP-sugar pyrophosphorylase family protein